MRIGEQEIKETLDRAVDRLLHLGGANYDEDKTISVAEALKTGNVARDAGIEEWDWPQGVGLYGLKLLQDYCGDGRYMDFLEKWYHRNIETGLPSKNINTTAPYLTLIQILDALPEKEEYGQLCRDRAAWLMDGLPKTGDNGFQHVTTAIGDRNGVILNDGQLWADTIFMAVLFLQQAGIRFDEPAWRSEALHQVLVHIKYLYDKNTGFLYHGYRFDRRDNFGGIFWCRGDSWITLGLTLFLEAATDLDAGVRDYLTDTYRTHAAAMRDSQAPSGLWHTVLDDPSSYEETSGSAAIAAGLIRGRCAGFLDDSFLSTIERAIAAICANVDRDGTVLQVSAGTSVGMDADHYKNIMIAPMAYGQSLTIIALTEALRSGLFA